MGYEDDFRVIFWAIEFWKFIGFASPIKKTTQSN